MDKYPLSERGLIKNFIENLKHKKIDSNYTKTVGLFRDKFRLRLHQIDTIDEYLMQISDLCNRVETLVQERLEFGLIAIPTPSKNTYPGKTQKDYTKAGGIKKRILDHPGTGIDAKKVAAKYINEGKPEHICTGCGRCHDPPTKDKPCPFHDHPDYNRSSKPFAQSAKGREWAARPKPRY